MMMMMMTMMMMTMMIARVSKVPTSSVSQIKSVLEGEKPIEILIHIHQSIPSRGFWPPIIYFPTEGEIFQDFCIWDWKECHPIGCNIRKRKRKRRCIFLNIYIDYKVSKTAPPSFLKYMAQQGLTGGGHKTIYQHKIQRSKTVETFFATWTNIVRCVAKKEHTAGGHNHKSKQNSKKPNFSFVPENNIVWSSLTFSLLNAGQAITINRNKSRRSKRFCNICKYYHLMIPLLEFSTNV